MSVTNPCREFYYEKPRLFILKKDYDEAITAQEAFHHPNAYFTDFDETRKTKVFSKDVMCLSPDRVGIYFESLGVAYSLAQIFQLGLDAENISSSLSTTSD